MSKNNFYDAMFSLVACATGVGIYYLFCTYLESIQ